MERKLIYNCLVPEDESGDTLLHRKLELYEDEPDVSGEVITKRVEVLPGLTRTIEFVVLWRQS
jgi:hypothetical protein